jgi:hypothetical protein
MEEGEREDIPCLKGVCRKYFGKWRNNVNEQSLSITETPARIGSSPLLVLTFHPENPLLPFSNQLCCEIDQRWHFGVFGGKGGSLSTFKSRL